VALVGSPVQVSTATAEIAGILNLQIDLGTATVSLPTAMPSTMHALPPLPPLPAPNYGMGMGMGMGGGSSCMDYMMQPMHTAQLGAQPRAMQAAPQMMPVLNAPLLNSLIRVAHNWPDPMSTVGKRIGELELTPGNLRHEMLVDKTSCGRIIGAGGAKLRELQMKSACNIFVVDKEVPPGRTDQTRAVVLVGPLAALSAAAKEIETLAEPRPPKRQAMEVTFDADQAIHEAKRRFLGAS